MRDLIERFQLLFELTKWNVCLPVTLSASAGFILARERITAEMLTVACGVLFLACGSCSLNQVQDQKIDALMERTKTRPLPSGRVDRSSALRLSWPLMGLGLFILFFGIHPVAGVLGIGAMFWYNGLYSFLKRRTAFAVVPGALIGAIPPAIGWVAGGGNLLDSRLAALAFFFFIWQVPHFWLLLLCFESDYQKAGLPTFSSTFASIQARRIIAVWLFSTATASLLIPLFFWVNSRVTLAALWFATLWFVVGATGLWSSNGRRGSLRYVFTRLNLYALCVISLLSLDRLFQWGT